MKQRVCLVAAAIVLAILLFSAPSGLAIEHNFIEDFWMSVLKDPVHTTAWWDTEAQELKLYPFVPTIMGTYNTSGNAWSVAIDGQWAFVADEASGLRVIDISDPVIPTLTGTYDTPGSARGVAVDGDRVFVADGDNGLQVIDVSDPASPALLGTYNTSGSAWGVAVSGSRVFVADNLSGLQIIDISNPANPILVGTCDTPGMARSVAISGYRAFVADYGNGLQVIDISDPSTPTLVGTCDTPGSACGVAVSGYRAYVADFGSGLQVIDISDPATPTIEGNYPITGYAWSIAVSGDRAFLACDYAGLIVIDISDPASPTLVQTCNTPGAALGVAVSGTRSFVADYDSGLQLIDISDPAIAIVGIRALTPDIARDVGVSGSYAFVAGYNSLKAIDISDPTNPSNVGICGMPVITLGVTIAGDYALVPELYSGMQVIDISDPAYPAIIGTCDTPGEANCIAVSGTCAIVADGSAGIQVIDISDPTNPTIVGTCDTPGDARRVAVSGDKAYIADGYSGFQVIDISDPAIPVLAGSCLTGYLDGVTVSGDHAFVGDCDYGLQVIDISDPTNPIIVGIYETPGCATRVAVSGDYAFVVDLSSGLQVINISDPTSPALVGSYGESFASGLAVSGEHAFLAAGSSGLAVIQAFQSEFNTDDNTGRSLVVAALDDTIVAASLLTTQTAGMTWELSADHGVSWQEFPSNGSRARLSVPGTDLMWRSTHAWTAGGINPTVSQLEIDWLYRFPLIEAVTDVGNDQGRQVRIGWTRSGNDFVGASQQIIEYTIYRRIDAGAMTCEEAPAAVSREAAATDPEIATMLTAGWDYVTAVPADADDEYSVVVSTLADSTIFDGQHWSVFLVRARTATPGVYYQSCPDSGYSVDNLEPNVPEGFAVAYNTGSGNELTWNESEDEDFRYFCIYRSASYNFTPNDENRVDMTTVTTWTDPEYDGGQVYYKITAVDFSGNESDPVSPGTVTSIDEPVIPQMYCLYQNVPNPFNPNTTIRYDVATGGGQVTILIYDVSGRLLRTLVAGKQTAGQKTAVWDGRDDHGRGVTSGVYFYRLEAPGYNKTLKMILIQ
jgi:hypothetical protein